MNNNFSSNQKQNGQWSFEQWLKQSKVYLHFENGKVFEGYINLSPQEFKQKHGDHIWGEAAFTTGMSGYQETCSDPSFLGQHIIFSTAHIGNYEANAQSMQSHKIHGSSIIARHISKNAFWADCPVPLVTGIDTRSLVKFLTKSECSHQSVLSLDNKIINTNFFKNAPPLSQDLKQVSTPEIQTIIPGERPIVVIDYGIKKAIVENLKRIGFPLKIFPYQSSFEEIIKQQPSLVFLSNGPGDPRLYQEQIEVVKKLLKTKIPLRAICLGHQLISLGLGAKVIKLPFGQRGINHPVSDLVSGEILITSQNHGYATEEKSFHSIAHHNIADRSFFVQHRSLFDQSIEGLSSLDHAVKSVQFHPEASPGPRDAFSFFLEIESFLKNKGAPAIEEKNLFPFVDIKKEIKKNIPYKKILIIGSGPIKIGQASEFDYSGTQALKALKSIGLDVVLLNSNPATIMTDPQMAYRTYIEPINKETIKKIIDIERVDAVLSTMGGQTALNLCVDLEKENYFKKKGVKLLGATVDTINKTEDRDLFAQEMQLLNYKAGKRFKAHSPEEAMKLANSAVFYPLIIRRDFALGGHGAALVYNDQELKNTLTTDLKFPITMEKSLVGQKEIELEVMIDGQKNGVIICSIENVDPCGIHTGDSITVAPAQTISDSCYQTLRTMALKIAKHMGVVAGGANVQFAINPSDETDITVIEMNPRVSRSSALASKATGYPIAKISALLAVGYSLAEILNDITKASPVAFEPTLDYVAVKIPIFPFNKFPTSSRVLGPQMRSVGEVLALAGSFTEAFLKALRSLELGVEIPSLEQLNTTPLIPDIEYYRQRLKSPQELGLLAALDALRKGLTLAEIHSLSAITPWFLDQMALVLETEREIKQDKEFFSHPERFRFYKSLGFSDKYLALLKCRKQEDVYQYRIKNNIFPCYKAVDTCAGEFAALTPYFYSTYGQEYYQNEMSPLSQEKKSVLVLGSGPNRIGQGIEFDYSCVKACGRLKEKNIFSIMANSNPETVSTDYDTADRLYITPLFSEDINDILLAENPYGIIACFAGQTGIKIREKLEKSFRKEYHQWNFLGSSMETLDLTENRMLFAEIIKDTELSLTNSKEAHGYKQLVNAMIEIGPPVIIRPSYVIGGESMYIFNSPEDVEQLPLELRNSLKNSDMTFLVENYLNKAIEYDVDLIRDHQGNCLFTVCEHIEYAGVHSGDSGMITPPVLLTSALFQKMKGISEKLAERLKVIGPINFQYAVLEDKIFCIEANPRGSRTLPFVSKAYHLSFPSIATDALLGETITPWHKEYSPFFAVKQSTFPFDRFIQDNILLGPKMRSTGETMGIDSDKESAILKSYLGNYPKLMNVGRILISLSDKSKSLILPYLKTLHQKGYEFAATKGTNEFIRKQGLPCILVLKIKEGDTGAGPSLLEIIKEDVTKIVFNVPYENGKSKSEGEQIRNAAIQYGIPCFTREENIMAVIQCLIGQNPHDLSPLSLQEAAHDE